MTMTTGLQIHLTEEGRFRIRQRLEALMPRRYIVDYVEAAALELLLDSLPDTPQMWTIPPGTEKVLRQRLGDIDDIARAVRLNAILQRRSAAAYLKRYDLARRLFRDWVGATDPEILAVTWGNLSPADRHHWIALADKELTEERKAV